MKSSSIRVERASRVVGLLGEAREIGLGTEAARCHLVTSALALLGASCGAVILDSAHRPGGKRGVGATTGVNFNRDVAKICEALDAQGCGFNPVHLALMSQNPAPSPGEIMSATDEIVSRRAWNRSELFNEYIRPARVDRYLTSMRYLGNSTVHAFGFFRAAGDRPFTEEDRHVLHLVHFGVGQIFDPDAKSRELTPRARQALEVLLTGASDKEIAGELDISPHTARQYVKMILKAYGVTSRMQLIARLRGSSIARHS